MQGDPTDSALMPPRGRGAGLLLAPGGRRAWPGPAGAAATWPARSHSGRRWRFGGPVGLLAFLLFLGLALAGVLRQPVPGPHDEWQHLSYAGAVQAGAGLRPRFETQYQLDENDLGRVTGALNYIGHPAPYYAYVALFLDRTLPAGRAVLLPRLASLALFAAAIGLVLAAGRRWFGDDPLAWLCFCGLVVLCPKQLLTAQQVTNDALAALGGGLAYWGAARLGRAPGGAAAIGLGLLLALWAKLNAGLVIGLWAGCLLLYLRSWRLFASLALAGLAGALPYADILVRYGRLVPVTWESVTGFTHRPLPLAEGLGLFLGQYPLGWSVEETPGPLLMVAFLALLGAMLGGAWLGWRRRGELAGLVALGAGIAFVLGTLVQLGFTLTVLGGSRGGAAFRYVLPLWPMLAHAVALLARQTARPWLPAGLLALVLFASIGGLLR